MTDKLVELKYITREHQVRDEQNARYTTKRMQSIKQLMAKKGRVCAKVDGKQKCPDCKDFSKEKKFVHLHEANYDMMFDDPQLWFDTHRIEGIGQKASTKTYKP